jgi:hypothetical protein
MKSHYTVKSHSHHCALPLKKKRMAMIKIRQTLFDIEFSEATDE